MSGNPLPPNFSQRRRPATVGCPVSRSIARTGTLYICLSDRGLFRSTDQGKTWERYGKDVPKGRTETPGCLQLDPTGKTKRFVCATVYGGSVILGSTDADSWRTVNEKCKHVDWYAADWSDTEMRFALAYKHEAGGILFVTHDGGKTFTETDEGPRPRARGSSTPTPQW